MKLKRNKESNVILTLRMTGERMKSEEESGIERFEHVVEDNRIAPDEAHRSEEERETVEGNDAVRGVNYCLVCFTWTPWREVRDKRTCRKVRHAACQHAKRVVCHAACKHAAKYFD